MTSPYAKDIAELKMAVTEQNVTLRHIAKQQGTLLQLLREVNGHVRQNTENIVALSTWRGDHEERHERLDTEVQGLRQRVNVVGVINAALTALAGALAAILKR